MVGGREGKGWGVWSGAEKDTLGDRSGLNGRPDISGSGRGAGKRRRAGGRAGRRKHALRLSFPTFFLSDRASFHIFSQVLSFSWREGRPQPAASCRRAKPLRPQNAAPSGNPEPRSSPPPRPAPLRRIPALRASFFLFLVVSSSRLSRPKRSAPSSSLHISPRQSAHAPTWEAFPPAPLIGGEWQAAVSPLTP